MSLSEPASRSLVTAGTSLCSRYPRPMCQAVILPVLEDKNIGNKRRTDKGLTYNHKTFMVCSMYCILCLVSGNPHSELLNRLIERCLDSHYRLLVLQ